jgi:molybdate transport system substrate-binding protein
LLAAASLAEAAPALGEAFHARGGSKVVVTTESSSRLVMQLRGGAPVDVLWVADRPTLDDAAPLLRPGTTRILAGNSLVMVVPAGHGTVDPTTVAGLPRIALAEEEVPAGRYARQALSPVWTAVAPHVVTADSVRSTLAWVARGEADVGVVYATDALAEPKVTVAYTFSDDSHDPIEYPAAIAADAAHAAEAEAFLAYCASPDGQKILADHGFRGPP